MTVVFVHGVPETASVWDGVRQHIGPDSTALRLPGFGTPRPPSFSATKEAYVAWVADELLRVPGPVDLVGHDWGALLAYRVAMEAQVPLRSWAADLGSFLQPEYTWHAVAQEWQRPGAGEELNDRLTGSEVSSDQSLAGVLRSAGVAPEHALAMHRSYDAVMAEAVLDLYRSAVPNPHHHWQDAYGPTRAPGLVLTPAEDPFDDAALAGAAAKRLGARHRVVPGVGHWWMLQDPVATAAVLDDFWASVATTPA